MKMALVYIAGYITRNNNQLSECEKYTNLTDHGKLKVPSDFTCQWLFFWFHPFLYKKGKGLL